MPNSFLPAISQGPFPFSGSSSHPDAKSGVFLLGDAWNMRHPLTGGGMTVALNDVVTLRALLLEVLLQGEAQGKGQGKGLRDWEKVRKVLAKWHWKRKPLASTINILSVALYDLFGADGGFLFLSFPQHTRKKLTDFL
jgi:squalene monooxygenase